LAQLNKYSFKKIKHIFPACLDFVLNIFELIACQACLRRFFRVDLSEWSPRGPEKGTQLGGCRSWNCHPNFDPSDGLGRGFGCRLVDSWCRPAGLVDTSRGDVSALKKRPGCRSRTGTPTRRSLRTDEGASCPHHPLGSSHTFPREVFTEQHRSARTP